MDHAYSEQSFLVAIKGKMNSTGHCIGIVQNRIVDATLMDGIELSCDSLGVVLGETHFEIIWCQTYLPSSDKVCPSLSIQTSKANAHKGYYNSSVKHLHHVRKYQIMHIIQFSARFCSKIVLDNKCYDPLSSL